MPDVDRRALAREYVETPRPAGIFAVRNRTTGRLLMGSAADLAGMLNRQRFQLDMGSHPDKELQADWKTFGAEAFAFEVLDRLEPTVGANVDPANELRVLRALWHDKLVESGVALYPRSGRIG